MASVEISWTEQEDVGPFLPSIKIEIFMSQRLLSSNNNSVKTVSFDNEFEEEDTIRMKNIESVFLFKPEERCRFCTWYQ